MDFPMHRNEEESGDCGNRSRPDSYNERPMTSRGSCSTIRSKSALIALKLEHLEAERAIQQRALEAEKRALALERKAMEAKYRLLKEQLEKKIILSKTDNNRLSINVKESQFDKMKLMQEDPTANRSERNETQQSNIGALLNSTADKRYGVTNCDTVTNMWYNVSQASSVLSSGSNNEDSNANVALDAKFGMVQSVIRPISLIKQYSRLRRWQHRTSVDSNRERELKPVREVNHKKIIMYESRVARVTTIYRLCSRNNTICYNVCMADLRLTHHAISYRCYSRPTAYSRIAFRSALQIIRCKGNDFRAVLNWMKSVNIQNDPDTGQLRSSMSRRTTPQLPILFSCYNHQTTIYNNLPNYQVRIPTLATANCNLFKTASDVLEIGGEQMEAKPLNYTMREYRNSEDVNLGPIYLSCTFQSQTSLLDCVRNQIHVDLNITEEFFECLPVPSILEFPTLNIYIGIEFNGITVDVHYHDEPVMIMSTNLKAGSMSSVCVGGFKPNVHETIEPSAAKQGTSSVPSQEKRSCCHGSGDRYQNYRCIRFTLYNRSQSILHRHKGHARFRYANRPDAIRESARNDEKIIRERALKGVLFNNDLNLQAGTPLIVINYRSSWNQREIWMKYVTMSQRCRKDADPASWLNSQLADDGSKPLLTTIVMSSTSSSVPLIEMNCVPSSKFNVVRSNLNLIGDISSPLVLSVASFGSLTLGYTGP